MPKGEILPPMRLLGRFLHGAILAFHGYCRYAAIFAVRRENLFIMNSQERKEARYQRRKAKRQQRKIEFNKSLGDYDSVLSYEHLYKSSRYCYLDVGWKHSIQAYRINQVKNTYETWKELQTRDYKGCGFDCFTICERGKERNIQSVKINERVVQRTLCDYFLTPIVERIVIHDNSASQKGKGIHFALNRFECHLKKHYRKFGTKGYILQFDFKNFFGSINHEKLFELIRKEILDEDIANLLIQLVKNFGEEGLGLGSQVSQDLAILFPNKLDHFIKIQLRIKGYGRYMDDGYLIHESKEYLEYCLTEIKHICSELGIVINDKKTKIIPLTGKVIFLKARFRLTESGKVVRTMDYKSVQRMRRKLKKFKSWVETGKFRLGDVCRSYISWKGHAGKGRNFHKLQRMDTHFKKLYGIHPNDKIKWRNALCM